MSISVGISSCPNDIYTYAGLLSGEVANVYDFKVGRIGELNAWALKGELDILKISAGTYPSLEDNYRVSAVGGSVGVTNGPKLVARRDRTDWNGIEVALPGLTTTAAYVLRYFFPEVVQRYVDMREIPGLVRDGVFAGGIVINESMGDLAKYNLKVILDLAQVWYEKMQVPLPLGMVVLAQGISVGQQTEFESLVRLSLAWAREHHAEAVGVAMEWGVEKGNRLAVEKHIREFTEYAGDSSRFAEAVSVFLDVAFAEKAPVYD